MHPACELEGHVPGLWARSPVGGVQEATSQCLSPSLSPCLPISLKINNKNLLKKENMGWTWPHDCTSRHYFKARTRNVIANHKTILGSVFF